MQEKMHVERLAAGSERGNGSSEGVDYLSYRGQAGQGVKFVVSKILFCSKCI